MLIVDGREVRLALADTPELRGRGLMRVTDLGDLDGMLFTWGRSDVTSGFTMRNTLIPLDIGFFAADGTLVDLLRMEPCQAEPCPTYRAATSYAFAIEVPVDGGLRLTETSSVDVGS